YVTGEVLGWDIASRAEVARIPGKAAIRGFSPDGSLMVIGSSSLRIFDVRSWSEVARYLSTGADSIAWHPDGSRLAVGELSGDLHVLRIENRVPSAPATPRATRTPRAKVVKAETASDAQAPQPRIKRPRKTPSTPEAVVEAPAHLAQASTRSELIVDVPQAHPAANPNRAMQLNLEYQEALKRWNSLSWWKRLRVKKPERPSGI